MTAVATFGGKDLVGFHDVKWTLRSGVLPSMSILPMAPADALSFNGNPGPHTLSIKADDGAPVTVENLWALKVLPGEDPYQAGLLVADLRWMWSMWHLGPRRYNKRRATGVKRVIFNDQAALPFDTAADLAYADYSLDSGKPWSAKRVLEDVLEALREKCEMSGVRQFSWTIQSDAVKTALPVEELEVDDKATGAVMLVLGRFPGTDLYVDYRGNVVVYSKAAGNEKDIHDALQPPIVGGGYSAKVQNLNVRPKEIHVLFTREIEWRLDFTEAASATSTTTAGTEGETVDNVVPVPDYQLEVSGQTVNQGTWIKMDAAFNAWGNLPLRGATKKLDHDLVQKAFIPHMDLWAALTISGQRPDDNNQLKDWVGRIAAVQNHYRRTFRCEKALVDKVYDIRAVRVATIDPQSGQRAPATAYGDYCIMASQRMIWKRKAEGGPLDYAINKSAYPTSGKLDDTASVSPAIVSVVDADQGIIHVDYVVDPNRSYEMILPSKIDESTMPCADYTKTDRPITFDSVIDGVDPPKLSQEFKLAVLLTVVPASPNTEAQLHRIKVKPSDVNSLLPQQVGACVGPIMEIRVGAGSEVARIQYLDDRKEDLKHAIGLVDKQGEPNLSGLVINEGQSSAQNGASLNNIANAYAAAIYASLSDRYYGETTGYLKSGLELKGYTTSVEHTVDAEGAATTRAVFPEDVPQMDFFAFLGASDRATLMKLVRQ